LILPAHHRKPQFPPGINFRLILVTDKSQRFRPATKWRIIHLPKDRTLKMSRQITDDEPPPKILYLPRRPRGLSIHHRISQYFLRDVFHPRILASNLLDPM